MSEKQEILIFSKNGKNIKWGIEFWDHCWKCKKVLHKGNEIAELLFGHLEENSLKPGYSAHKLEIDKSEITKFWEEFNILTLEEQIEKDTWEKESTAIEAKKELRKKYEEEFMLYLGAIETQRQEKLFEEFLKTKEKIFMENKTLARLFLKWRPW